MHATSPGIKGGKLSAVPRDDVIGVYAAERMGRHDTMARVRHRYVDVPRCLRGPRWIIM